MKNSFTLLSILLLSSKVFAQPFTNYNPRTQFHPDSLKVWTTDIMAELSRSHPGFYRYTSKSKFDFLIDSMLNTITDSLTEIDYYRKLKTLIGQIRCLHTGLSLSKDYSDFISNTSTLAPIDIFIDSSKRVFVTKDYSPVAIIPIRSEIISINGRPIADILRELLNAIPADGFVETEKILLLNHRFPFWYQSMIESPEEFFIVAKTDHNLITYHLKGVKSAVFPTQKSLEDNYKKAVEFESDSNVAILKVHSFARSSLKRSKQNFRKELKFAFKDMEQQNTQNLIVDLRYNSGGTDGNAALLASYFFDKPFRYWDRIEVTESIAKQIKGVNRLFYSKPIKGDSLYLWKKSWFTKEFDYYQGQKPAKHNFSGKTIILTNGLTMSSAADLVAVLSHNNKARVVGTESGGGYQGNTSGMMPSVEISPGLSVSIPLQKYSNAVHPDKNWGRGTLPDYPISPSLNDWIGNKDVEMEYALKILKTR